MRRLKLFWDSNVGKKVVMGATGIVMVLFVMQHVVGVFRIYQSATAINDSATIPVVNARRSPRNANWRGR